MEGSRVRKGWPEALGYGLGIGICFMATLGVWLQYSTKLFTAATGGLASLALGTAVGTAWALLRRNARHAGAAPTDTSRAG